MIKILLLIFLVSCGSEKVYQQEPVQVPGGGDKPPNPGGGGVAFELLFNGSNRPGDQACAGCHAGAPFVTSKAAFCRDGLNWVNAGRMPPTGSIKGTDLHDLMTEVCDSK